MITIPTTTQIRDQIIADYESALGQTVPVSPHAFIRIWAACVAGVLHLAYRFGAWIYRQIFASTADIEALMRIGGQYSVVRNPAVRAELTASVSGNASVVIPIGWTFQSNGVVFETTDAETLDGSGEGVIDIRCLTAGSLGNLDDGDELEIVTPIAGLDSEATVTATVTTGEDAEPIEDYRDRVLAKQQQKPQGGAIPDFISWTKEVPGVVSVVVARPVPGDVVVYPTVGTTEADRIPDSTKLDEITAYISDPVRCPLNAGTVEALAFTEVEFDVTFSDLVPSGDGQLQLDITNAVEAYLLSRFPRQYAVVNNPRDRITVMDLSAIARDNGAETVTVTLHDVTTPEADIDSYQLAVDELAKVGMISFV
jgi:uncharacterized phage protein gp47/JayE